MNIAIIGAGFSGLATAWHLLHSSFFSDAHITLFDQKNIGQSTSGISAGLLHPFTGAHATLHWKELEGLKASQQLLHAASSAIGHSVTAKNKGILRLAITDQQKSDFKLCAQRYPSHTRWLDSAACQSVAPGCIESPGLLILDGITVYPSLYLQGLWEDCKQKNIQFIQKKINSLAELSQFDHVIVTAGANCFEIEELSTILLKRVKGQLLELAWPDGREPLPYPLNSHVYLLMTEKQTSCLVGATFEKDYSHEEVDQERACKELLGKAVEIYPPLQDAEILHCYAGMRAVTAQRRPMIQQLSPSQWILTGMGSKGLLYHALFAEELVRRLITC